METIPETPQTEVIPVQETPEPNTPPKDPAPPKPGVEAILAALKKAIEGTEEDVDQVALIKVIQDNRAFVLQFAMQAYLDNPKNAHLLEGVTAIIAQIEKTVRDDRKERMKKKENENNQVAFSQMLEAMKNISSGAIAIPVFDQTDFILDPTKSLLELASVAPIKPEELEMGNGLVNIDGDPI